MDGEFILIVLPFITILPFASKPSPLLLVPALISISPLFIVINPFPALKLSPPDESLPPAAFIPSSVDVILILPLFIVIFNPSIPSYDFATVMFPSLISTFVSACIPSSPELRFSVPLFTTTLLLE